MESKAISLTSSFKYPRIASVSKDWFVVVLRIMSSPSLTQIGIDNKRKLKHLKKTPTWNDWNQHILHCILTKLDKTHSPPDSEKYSHSLISCGNLLLMSSDFNIHLFDRDPRLLRSPIFQESFSWSYLIYNEGPSINDITHHLRFLTPPFPSSPILLNKLME